jgi:hypothetical protein
VALGANGGVLGFAVTDADGRWTLTGLPVNFDFVVAAIPPFGTGPNGCQTDGPPPVPAAGALQPEFYDDTWADLSDQNLLSGPFAWANDPKSPHPAIALRNNRTGIDFCLTTETGRATERSSCDPRLSQTPTVTASATGSGCAGGHRRPSLLVPAWSAMVLAAVGIMARSARSAPFALRAVIECDGPTTIGMVTRRAMAHLDHGRPAKRRPSGDQLFTLTVPWPPYNVRLSA